jgi:hypothetical protein
MGLSMEGFGTIPCKRSEFRIRAVLKDATFLFNGYLLFPPIKCGFTCMRIIYRMGEKVNQKPGCFILEPLLSLIDFHTGA